MKKLDAFAVFGILFLSSVLLANGMYSNSISVIAQLTNEAEVNTDIEQENKCKKDTECENENKINNSLNILNNGTQQQQQKEPQTCEECFTTILTEQELNDLIQALGEEFEGLDNVSELCNFDDVIDDPGFREFFSGILFEFGTGVGISEDKINAILDCLEKIYGVEFPRPPFPTGVDMNSHFNWPITQ